MRLQEYGNFIFTFYILPHTIIHLFTKYILYIAYGCNNYDEQYTYSGWLILKYFGTKYAKSLL